MLALLAATVVAASSASDAGANGTVVVIDWSESAMGGNNNSSSLELSRRAVVRFVWDANDGHGQQSPTTPTATIPRTYTATPRPLTTTVPASVGGATLATTRATTTSEGTIPASTQTVSNSERVEPNPPSASLPTAPSESTSAGGLASTQPASTTVAASTGDSVRARRGTARNVVCAQVISGVR
jgi:hypothetical protein